MENRTNLSYLYARDPSIISWNMPSHRDCRKNLQNSFDKTEQVEVQEDVSLCVYLRLKGGVPSDNLFKIDGSTLIANVPEGAHCLRHVQKGEKMRRKFDFSKIFGPETTQEEIFNSIIKPNALALMNGKSSTLFTYGASGSGKTFTIVGTPEEPGIIPRALEYIFRTITGLKEQPEYKPLASGDIEGLDSRSWSSEQQIKANILNSKLLDRATLLRTYRKMQERLSSEAVAIVYAIQEVKVSLWVSFTEIYNEQVFDLLTAIPKGNRRQNLKLGNNHGDIFVKDLTIVHAQNSTEAYQILQYGLQNLNYAATAVNSHSSRSHCIFSMILLQTSSINDQVYLTKFNFCDLAGAERLKKTGNIGERLKESNNINTSLMILGRCIENIRNNQKNNEDKPVPFRESKLTQLFQKALLGHQNIAMIVNISPARYMFDETIHVLNFSAIAKDIIIEERPMRLLKKQNRFSIMMEKKSPIKEKIRPTMVLADGQREIEVLQEKINELYQQMEELKFEHDRQVTAELALAVDEYERFHDQKIKEHEQRKNEQIQKLKADYEKRIQDIQDQLQNQNDADDNDESIINISSSSAEDSFHANYFKSGLSRTAKEKTELKNTSADTIKQNDSSREMLEIQTLLEENQRLKENISIKESDQQRILDENIKFKLEISRLQNLIENKDELLKDAEDAFSDLQSENRALVEKNQRINAEICMLKDKYEQAEDMIAGITRNDEESE